MKLKSLKKRTIKLEKEKKDKDRIIDTVRAWLDRQSLLRLATVFSILIFFMLILLSYMFRAPTIQASRDVMSLIHAWNGERTSLDFYLTMTMILYWLSTNWLGLRVQIPQGTYVKTRRH